MKNGIEIPVGKLELSKIPKKLWTYLTVDFIYFVAITEGTSAEGLARLFKDNVWKLHRFPESILSDRRS